MHKQFSDTKAHQVVALKNQVAELQERILDLEFDHNKLTRHNELLQRYLNKNNTPSIKGAWYHIKGLLFPSPPPTKERNMRQSPSLSRKQQQAVIERILSQSPPTVSFV